MNTDKNDKELIAAFMGKNGSKYFPYKSSWDCLVPVIKKIAGVVIKFKCTSMRQFNQLLTRWRNILRAIEKLSIRSASKHSIEFIRWYNDNKKDN